MGLGCSKEWLPPFLKFHVNLREREGGGEEEEGVWSRQQFLVLTRYDNDYSNLNVLCFTRNAVVMFSR